MYILCTERVSGLPQTNIDLACQTKLDCVVSMIHISCCDCITFKQKLICEGQSSSIFGSMMH